MTKKSPIENALTEEETAALAACRDLVAQNKRLLGVESGEICFSWLRDFWVGEHHRSPPLFTRWTLKSLKRKGYLIDSGSAKQGRRRYYRLAKGE